MELFSFESILLDEKPTFHSNNGHSSSQIDHILYYVPQNLDIYISLKDLLCKLEHSANISSHDAIIGKIIASIKTKENNDKEKVTSYTAFNVMKPKWNKSDLSAYQNNSYYNMRYLLTQFDQPEHIPILSELSSKMLVMCAEKKP